MLAVVMRKQHLKTEPWKFNGGLSRHVTLPKPIATKQTSHHMLHHTDVTKPHPLQGKSIPLHRFLSYHLSKHSWKIRDCITTRDKSLANQKLEPSYRTNSFALETYRSPRRLLKQSTSRIRRRGNPKDPHFLPHWQRPRLNTRTVWQLAAMTSVKSYRAQNLNRRRT